MTFGSSKLPQPKNERPPVPPTNRGPAIDRLILLIALLLMLLIAGGFGYRLQISPTGLTFERSAETDKTMPKSHNP